MAGLLKWIRYSLVVVPAVGTAFLTPSGPTPEYILYILLAVFIVQIRERWLSAAARTVWMEIVYFAFLSYRFEGILFFLFESTLLSLYGSRATARFKTFMLLPIAAFMNAAISGHSSFAVLVANIAFFAFAASLAMMASASFRKQEMEMLYDELSRNHYELDENRQRLFDYAKKVEQMAQVEERNRISKELHDELGHRLIRMKMMMEAGLHIYPTQSDKAMDLFGQVRDQLTAGMETMRSTVRNMAPDEQEVNSYSLDKLIREIGTDSGITVAYHIRGLPHPLYPSMEYVLYRNAQEAITNAIRHGNADEVEVTLAYEQDSVVLTVGNNGSVPEHDIRRGLGMRGMEERVALHGGRLEIEHGSRFAITTTLPYLRTTEGDDWNDTRFARR